MLHKDGDAVRQYPQCYSVRDFSLFCTYCPLPCASLIVLHEDCNTVRLNPWYSIVFTTIVSILHLLPVAMCISYSVARRLQHSETESLVQYSVHDYCLYFALTQCVFPRKGGYLCRILPYGTTSGLFCCCMWVFSNRQRHGVYQCTSRLVSTSWLVCVCVKNI